MKKKSKKKQEMQPVLKFMEWFLIMVSIVICAIFFFMVVF